MKLEINIKAIIDDELWGFSNVLVDGGLSGDAQEKIMGLINEDITEVLDGSLWNFKIID